MTAGSVGKLLTYEKCCKENCEFPVGIHCNLAILSFKNVKQQEYGKQSAFLFVYDLRVSAL